MNLRIVPIALLAFAASCAPSKKKGQVQYLEDPPPEVVAPRHAAGSRRMSFVER